MVPMVPEWLKGKIRPQVSPSDPQKRLKGKIRPQISLETHKFPENVEIRELTPQVSRHSFSDGGRSDPKACPLPMIPWTILTDGEGWFQEIKRSEGRT